MLGAVGVTRGTWVLPIGLGAPIDASWLAESPTGNAEQDDEGSVGGNDMPTDHEKQRNDRLRYGSLGHWE